jgi:hypothetical protein
MDLFSALVLAAVLCLIESRNCRKRSRMWDAIADIEERIEELKEARNDHF